MLGEKMEKVVIATVGDIEITKEQMINILQSLPQEHAASVAGEEGRARLLDEMIAGELLYLDAKKKNLEQEDAYKALLEDTARTLLQRYAVNKLFDEIKITDEEAQKHYDENRDQYTEPEKASAKHILVDTEEKAQGIKEEIEAGKTFEDAAKEHSTCPSKDRGGDLGEFGRGQMVKEFEDAAFDATIGELVGPVQTQFGFHLLVVDKVIPAAVQPFEQVKAMIEGQLGQEKRSEVYFSAVDELKKEYPVKVNPEALK